MSRTSVPLRRPQVPHQLLSGKDQPAQLRLFAMQTATADPAQSLELFADELGKWERPNRGAKLVALHERRARSVATARVRVRRAQSGRRE